MSQLITCPECTKHLQVPDELVGKKVQCPECRHTFTAQESTPTEVVSSTSTTASKPGSAASSTTKKKAEWDKHDDEEDDTRSRKSKPPEKRRRSDDDDDDDDDEDDYDDIRRRRRRSSHGGRDRYMPHRGGMILAFGIISMVSFLVFGPLALIFGPMAWFMGNADMAEIRAGRMDPSGESMVQTGRILGIISTVIGILGVLAFVGLCCIVPMMGAALNPRG